MKKSLIWDNSKNIQSHLEQALMVYETLLEQNDVINQKEYDFRKSEFKKKLDSQEFIQYWLNPADLLNSDRLHYESHDFTELSGTIVVIKYNSDLLILDGNHRLEFILSNNIKTKVFVTEISFPSPQDHRNYFFSKS